MTHLLLVVIYLSFISLGLPDSLLGSAWPSIYPTLHVPVSFAGIISAIISAGTIFSSLQSERVTRRFGPGKVTALSVACTAAALFGFSQSREFFSLCLWAIPYGLGAGGVDAALNNYVALHYSSRHMSWLHCMWGVGASVGPVIMAQALAGGRGWPAGYRWIALMQIVLSLFLFISLPLWRRPAQSPANSNSSTRDFAAVPESPPGNAEALRIPGVKPALGAFFCYCALESTVGLWASSFLVLSHAVLAEQAAAFAGLFYLGITTGRALSGFLTFKFPDHKMIRLGQLVLALGILLLIISSTPTGACIGFAVIGLGCAPIYPSVIHATPARFGARLSQTVIGMQMAGAYLGSCLMPPIWGWMTRFLPESVFPFWVAALFTAMALLNKRTEHLTRRQ